MEQGLVGPCPPCSPILTGSVGPHSVHELGPGFQCAITNALYGNKADGDWDARRAKDHYNAACGPVTLLKLDVGTRNAKPEDKNGKKHTVFKHTFYNNTFLDQSHTVSEEYETSVTESLSGFTEYNKEGSSQSSSHLRLMSALEAHFDLALNQAWSKGGVERKMSRWESVVTIPKMTKTTVSMEVTRFTGTVPYTATFEVADMRYELKGTWKGVALSDGTTIFHQSSILAVPPATVSLSRTRRAMSL